MEQRGEHIASRYGLFNFFQQLRYEEAKEAKDANDSKNGRKTQGRSFREGPRSDRVRMRDEEEIAALEGEEEEEEEAGSSKKQKRAADAEVEAEASEERPDTPQQRLARLLASQLSGKREADAREEERRKASATQIFVAFDKDARTKEEAEEKKKEKKKEKKEKKKRKKLKKGEKKEKKRETKKQSSVDPLDAALNALKKKHQIN